MSDFQEVIETHDAPGPPSLIAMPEQDMAVFEATERIAG